MRTRSDGASDPPPLVHADGASIVCCAGPSGQPCQADQVYHHHR
jgi:hypothetical protein